jgi:hypothetical protein
MGHFLSMKYPGYRYLSRQDYYDLLSLKNTGYWENHLKERQMYGLLQLWNELKAGKTFWEVVKKPYLDRELNRSEAKCLIEKAFIEAGGKYIESLKIFNLEDKEYNNFIRFLHANRLTHLAEGV